RRAPVSLRAGARNCGFAWSFLDGALLLRVGRDAPEAAAAPSAGADAEPHTGRASGAKGEYPLRVSYLLKAIVRSYSYLVLPITWGSRKTGTSSLHLEEQGPRYLFIVLYVWLE